MRAPTKKRLFWMIASLLLVLFLIRHLTSPREPIHKGKTLSTWLNDYWIDAHSNSEEELLIAQTNRAVDEIVREIGTNAIPTLLRMLTATDSPLRKMAYVARDRGWYDFKFSSAPALAQNIQAAMAFRALGADARDAVPDLVEKFNDTIPDNSADLLAYALGGIGPSASNAVPSLLKAATNKNLSWAPYKTLSALGEIHAQPQAVVPVLITFLKHPDVNVRRKISRYLQAFGADARSAIPALTESLTDQDEYVRKYAAQALTAIDPEAAAEAGVE